MTDCDKKERLIIVQGDFTGYGDVDWLKLNPTSEVWDLATMHATFELNGIVKTFDDLTQPFSINYEAAETASMPLGDIDGVLRFYDSNNKPVTIDNLIPVTVVKYVHGDAVKTGNYEMNIEVKQGDEVVMEVLVEAGVSVEPGNTYTLDPGEPARVVNRGTASHLILDFYIPKGDKGDQGEQGEPGEQGIPGQPGADGKDATVNGVNTLTLTAADGLELVQNDSTATVSGLALQRAVNSKLAQKPDGSHDIVENNKITKTYLPDFVLGQLIYAGVFVPTTAVATLTTNGKAKLGTSFNTITLTNDTSAITGYEANEGCFYLCTADGTFAGISLLTGDWLISTGSSWQKVDNTDAVTGIKGDAEVSYRIGNVNITLDNVAPAQSGNSGKVIMTDGTNALWQSLPVSSVTVNGVSVVVNGVAVIPLATASGGYGLVKLSDANTGLTISNSGNLVVSPASNLNIEGKANAYKPIVPSNLDYAVKRGIAYNSLTLTDAEKASACSLVGALPNNIYGESTTAASTVQKEVSIPSITSLNAGQLIIVTPTATSTVANSTLKLNNFPAYPMLYGGSAITTSTDSYVWIKDVPGWWLFDGSNWLFAGHGTDINTTYSAMTVANIIAGTETSGRLMRSDYLKDGICGVVTAYSSGDTITPADKYLYTSTADISAFTVNAPDSPDVRYVSQINFSSGTTATTLSYPNTFKLMDGCDDVQTVGGVRVFVPVANKRYQMFILNDGVNNLLVAKGV